MLIKMQIYNTYKTYKNLSINKLHNPITTDNELYISNLKKYIRGVKTGGGLLNTILKKVPLPELHLSLPTGISSETVQNGSFNNTGKYSFCGPGTKVQKRLQEGYKGVNSLDKACKEHDIYYGKYKSTKERNIADDILAQQASRITLDSNEPEYVRNQAKTVTAVMATKSKFGMGSKND